MRVQVRGFKIAGSRTRSALKIIIYGNLGAKLYDYDVTNFVCSGVINVASVRLSVRPYVRASGNNPVPTSTSACLRLLVLVQYCTRPAIARTVRGSPTSCLLPYSYSYSTVLGPRLHVQYDVAQATGALCPR